MIVNFEKTELIELEKNVEHLLAGVVLLQQHGWNQIFVSIDPFTDMNPGVMLDKNLADYFIWTCPVNIRVKSHEDTQVLVGYGTETAGCCDKVLTPEEIAEQIEEANFGLDNVGKIAIIGENGQIRFIEYVPNVFITDDDEGITPEQAKADWEEIC